MSKSKARFLAELLSSDGKVIKAKSQASTIVVGDLPTIPNSKLANSSITINTSATSLGGSVTLTTANVAENTNLYFTNARADARIVNAGSANWNTAYGWGNHASAGYTTTDTTYSVGDGGLTTNNFTDADHSKLNAIEASADVTDTTNVVAALTAGTNITIAANGTIASTDTNTTYSVGDGGLSQNNFTNADHSKLNAIEASANVTDTANVVAALTAGTNITIAANGTIASTDTNTTYSVGDGGLTTNNFTDADHSKLNAIEASATADQTNAEIRTAVEAATDSNVFTDADHTKLGGIAASANNYTLPSGYATETYVGTQISNLVDSSPAALNTLNELAAAIGDDASFSTTVTNNIATKLPKAGGTMTGKLIAPRISINRDGTAAGGYNYYNETLNTWQTYMSPAGQTGAGYNGNLTAPSGTYVTGWAIRSVVEPIAGYGWTWEELANSATTGQSVIAELSSNTGNFKTIGNMYASGGNSTQWNTAYTVANAALPKAGGTLTGDLTVGGTTQVTASEFRITSSAAHTTHLNYNNTGTNYISQANGGTTYIRNSAGTLFTFGSGGTLNVHSGNFQMGGTTVIDASRNLTNIGTISSGAITSTGIITSAEFFKATGNNAKFSAGGTHVLNIDVNRNIYPVTHNSTDLGFSDTLAFRNLHLVGAITGGATISSGAITAPSIRASSGAFHINRGSDGTSAIRVDADGVVVIPTNYFYVSASQGSYFSSAVRFRGTISNDTGTNVTFGQPISVSGTVTATGGNSTNWNTAYGWGNHASAGYTNDQTAAEILTAIKTVDGSGSGLDADLLDGVSSASFLRSDADDSFSGGLVSTARDEGIFGTYDPAKTDHIWSMGVGYKNHASGTNFGTLYGLAYKHTNNTTGGAMGGGHQMVWCNSGTPRAAMGYDRFWHAASGNLWGSSNDGSGSGLDADLLDGNHASAFATSAQGTLATNALPKAGGTLTGNVNLSGSTNHVIIGGAASSNHYNSTAATTGLTFGGGNDFNNYSIGTSMQNIGGNYTKLNIKWHTGIRFFVLNNYGGVRFYSDVGMTTELMSIGNTDAHVRVANNLYANGSGLVWNANNDGANSTLDADLLDGQHGSYYYAASNPNGYTNDQTAAEILAALKTVDVNGTAGVNAGTLDGLGSGSFARLGGTNHNRTIPNRWFATGDNDNNIDYYTHAYAKAHMGNTYKYTTSRPVLTSDSSYWVGSMGWAATDLNYMMANGSGFWDAWSLAAHNRPSSSTQHWNGFNAMHYSASPTNQYGMQMAMGSGNPSLTYLRGQWGASVRDWQKIWTSGNDGANSTLDADLLDGQHGSYYLPATGNAATATALTAGNKTIAGQLTVGNTTSSDIFMVDTDEGTRRIHCNSNRIGFLTSSNAWSCYSTDAGRWDCNLGLTVSNGIINNNAGINYVGTTVTGGTSNMIGFRWIGGANTVNVGVDNAVNIIIGTASDYRLKIVTTNDIGDSLSRLKSLNTYEYTSKDEDTGTVYRGVLAHEVAKLFPNLVLGAKDDPDQLQSVNHAAFTIELIQAMKQLDARLTAIEAHLNIEAAELVIPDYEPVASPDFVFPELPE